MQVNFSQFSARMRTLVQEVDKASKDGVAQASMALLRDSIMQQPTVPLDLGTLRGSGSVMVDNVLVDTSQQMTGQTGRPCTDHNEPKKRGQIIGVIGFNTGYAAQIHEGLTSYNTPVRNWSEPGSGAKYLESKLVRNKAKYIRLMEAAVKKALRP